MLTVFTPTFNRAHTLGRVYESLRKQSNYNFEWVIVD
ncbi:glycosyltransferase family 2 protein, partial [Staphylococcus simulans]